MAFPSLNQALGASAAGLLSIVGRRAKVLGLGEVEDELRDIRGGQQLLIYYWFEDVIPLLMAIQRSGTRLGADFAYVCGDTWVGGLVSALLAKLGRRTLCVRFSDEALRVRDVQALVRESAPVSITADGRGPYGQVHVGLQRLVERRDAVAIPLSACASRGWRVWTSGGPIVPLPGARIAVALGSPIRKNECGNALSVAALGRGLRRARLRSLRLLASERSPISQTA